MNERVPITVDDLYDLGWLEDPRWSPDGRMIACVRGAVDRAGNRDRRAIWLAAADGSTFRRFTAGTHNDTAPRWSPDDRTIAFVSDRSGTSQLYVINCDGGEARVLTSMAYGAHSPAWSPDGRRIAFLSNASASERATEDAGEQQLTAADSWEAQQREAQRAHAEEQRFDPRVITRLPYRGGTAFYDDRRSHVYLLDLPEDAEAATPAPRRLTDGDWHHSAPVWMPDGHSLLTTATRDPEADSIFSYYDLLQIIVPDQGRGEAKRLTSAGFSYDDPQPSPDGRWIALRRLPEDRPLAAGARIALLAADGGAVFDLTAAIDLSVEQHYWLPDSSGLLYSAEWRGAQAIYQVAAAANAQQVPADSAPQPLTEAPSRIISEFAIGPDGSIAFIAGTPENPGELFVRRANGSEAQLSNMNAALLASHSIAPTEELVYAAPDGREVQGWLVYPPGFDRSKQYPLAIHIHGGPHVMWGPGYRGMWHEWQANAARGYVVFFCNPRGSEGYGEAWRDGIHANWGVADAPDIMAGIDAVIARGGIDPARIAVTGGSYGGYMTTWLLAHSDRFACGVSARGVYNLLSEHSTSDAHELIELEFDGYPWEMHELLWQHSPLAHAHKISTPLRILHSERDYRVPISEAEQLFAILRRRKQVVELVRYPRDGHELTRTGEPRHRADHMERTLEWFDRYCMGEEVTR